MIDKTTESQEWIDSLVEEYAPNSHDIDVALQNMGLKIKHMQKVLDFYRLEAEAIAKNLNSNDEAILASIAVLNYYMEITESFERKISPLIEK